MNSYGFVRTPVASAPPAENARAERSPAVAVEVSIARMVKMFHDVKVRGFADRIIRRCKNETQHVANTLENSCKVTPAAKERQNHGKHNVL